MARLTPIAEALEVILGPARPLAEEWAPLHEADGRVLTRDLAARRTQPPQDVSSMDGYAARAADLPGRLQVIGEAAAGHPFAGFVSGGTAVRIFTGAEMPAGADTVVMQEDVTRDGESVAVPMPSPAGRFIRPRGLDFSEGVTALAAGTRLNPRNLALAAAMNHPALPVHRRPHVAILSTGDELVEPGTAPGPGQIVSSNAFALAAIARREGAVATVLPTAPDRQDETLAAVRGARAAGVDILVTSGGASVGEYDLMNKVIAAEGATLGFWKIAMRPGKPLMTADLSGMRLIGLPGNPVASFVCALLFLVPLIRSLSGRTDLHLPEEEAVLGDPLPANDQREDYLRARLIEVDGQWRTSAFGVQDSSMMRLLCEADVLIVRPAFAEPAPKGAPCRILRLPR